MYVPNSNSNVLCTSTTTKIMSKFLKDYIGSQIGFFSRGLLKLLDNCFGSTSDFHGRVHENTFAEHRDSAMVLVTKSNPVPKSNVNAI